MRLSVRRHLRGLRSVGAATASIILIAVAACDAVDTPSSGSSTPTGVSTSAGGQTATPQPERGAALPTVIADRGGTPAGAPAAATPSTSPPIAGATTTTPATPPSGAEVSGEVQAFIDASRAVSTGAAITASVLGAASPQVSALLASGRARLTTDALQVYVEYAGEVAAARSAIEGVGGTIELAATDRRLIQARVPVTRLAVLQSAGSITRIRLPESAIR